MTARQTGWRETFAGISVGVYQYDGQECGWWDIPTGTTVHMLDGTTRTRNTTAGGNVWR